MQIDTKDLDGEALRWAVAKAEGHEVMLFDTLWRNNAAGKGFAPERVEQHLRWQPLHGQQCIVVLKEIEQQFAEPKTVRTGQPLPDYAADWSLTGPLIQREKIQLTTQGETWIASSPAAVEFDAHRSYVTHSGETPLLAALRCYVGCKLGPVVEVPDDLVPPQSKAKSGLSL